MLAPETVLQNRYRIIRRLGEGGMGAVYEAVDLRLHCTVALKETFADTDDQRRAFEREARLLANLRHPALPKVMDHFAEGPGQFLVMEFIPGDDFEQLLARRALPFTVEEVLPWADTILRALEHLHTRQPPILHRDIKPANIKLTADGEIYLLDFGLAKGVSGQMTQAHSKSVYGYTPHYAPPEQMQGTGTDFRSDIYSFGATLYHLLTGVQPPDAMSRAIRLATGDQDPLTPADTLNPRVPREIAALLSQAMSLKKERRHASAAEMGRLLREASRTESAAAPSNTQTADESRQQSTQHQDSVQPTPERRQPSQEPPVYEPAPFIKSGQEQEAAQQPLQGSEQATQAAIPSKHKTSRRIPVGAIAAVIALVAVVASAVLFWPSFLSDSEMNANAGSVVASNSSVNAAKNPVATSSPSPQSMTSRIDMGLVLIPAGSFMMGASNAEMQRALAHGKSRGDDVDLDWFKKDGPRHRVTISGGFYMGRYEVTQAQWQQVMGNNPSSFKGCDNCPVEQVSWDDAQEFIRKLNALNDGFAYRLPTEAEWEYAARAGTTTEFAFGDSLGSHQANFNGNYPYGGAAVGIFREKTTPVGSFQPSAWGLYDMHGNVWEWCADVWHESYSGAPMDGSAWMSGADSDYRVIRGGSWLSPAYQLRSANHGRSVPDDRHEEIGFRVVAVAQQ